MLKSTKKKTSRFVSQSELESETDELEPLSDKADKNIHGDRWRNDKPESESDSELSELDSLDPWILSMLPVTFEMHIRFFFYFCFCFPPFHDLLQ